MIQFQWVKHHTRPGDHAIPVASYGYESVSIEGYMTLQYRHAVHPDAAPASYEDGVAWSAWQDVRMGDSI